MELCFISSRLHERGFSLSTEVIISTYKMSTRPMPTILLGLSVPITFGKRYSLAASYFAIFRNLPLLPFLRPKRFISNSAYIRLVQEESLTGLH